MLAANELIDELLLIASRRSELVEGLKMLRRDTSTKANEKRTTYLSELTALEEKEKPYKAQIQPDIRDALKQRIQSLSQRTEHDRRFAQLEEERIDIEFELAKAQLKPTQRVLYQTQLRKLLQDLDEINQFRSRRRKLHRLLTLLENNIDYALRSSPISVEKSASTRLQITEPEIELKCIREDVELLKLKQHKINKSLIEVEATLSSTSDLNEKSRIEREKLYLIEQRDTIAPILAYLQKTIDEKLSGLTGEVELRTSYRRLSEIYSAVLKKRLSIEKEIQSLDNPLQKEELKNELAFLTLQSKTLGDMIRDLQNNKGLTGPRYEGETTQTLIATKTYRSILKRQESNTIATDNPSDLSAGRKQP